MLDEALSFWPPVPVVFMIDEGDEKTAVEALKQGAANYVTKGRTTDLRLFQVLSDVLARSQAELTAQRRAREMGVLNAVLTSLNRALDEVPVLDTIVQEVMAVIGTEACSIILVDKGSDQLFLRASTRLPVRDMVLPVPASKSIAGRVVREKKGCITGDVTRDPDWHSLGLGYSVDAMCTVPLMSGGEAFGVLQAINKGVGPFLPSDLELMGAIAAVASAAIMRGRQFSSVQEVLQKRAEQSATFSRLGETIIKQIDALEAALDPSTDYPQLAVVREKARQLLDLVAD
jgi:GAF domain-containing protein